MDFTDYHRYAKDTDLGRSMDYYFNGLAEECGEIAGLRKRLLRGDYKDETKHPLGEEEYTKDLKSELGDALWYLTMIAEHNQIALGEVASENLEKLQERKKKGLIKGKGSNR